MNMLGGNSNQPPAYERQISSSPEDREAAVHGRSALNDGHDVRHRDSMQVVSAQDKGGLTNKIKRRFRRFKPSTKPGRKHRTGDQGSNGINTSSFTEDDEEETDVSGGMFELALFRDPNDPDEIGEEEEKAEGDSAVTCTLPLTPNTFHKCFQKRLNNELAKKVEAHLEVCFYLTFYERCLCFSYSAHPFQHLFLAFIEFRYLARQDIPRRRNVSQNKRQRMLQLQESIYKQSSLTVLSWLQLRFKQSLWP